MSGAGSGAVDLPEGSFGTRYEPLQLLGSGGMSTVWRARDRVLKRDVALKIVKREVGQEQASDAEQARSTNEARLLAGMNHPHLVAVLDAGGEVPGRLDYLVMELVAGPTLRDRIRDGALGPGEVVRIGAELSSALAYVHDRGVVHRDLKPANILFASVEPGASAKLADFGIARLLSAAHLTTTGMLVGTASYVSPEQATGSSVATPSDVYSLGLVLLEAVTGAPAFEGDGVAAAAARVHQDPDVSAVADARTRRLLQVMTARDPAARPDAGTVATGFQALAAGDTAAFDALPLASGQTTTRALASAEATEPMAAPTRIDAAPSPPVPVAPPVAARVVTTEAVGPAAPAERAPRRILPAVLAGALMVGILLALGAVILIRPDKAPASGPTAPARSTSTSSADRTSSRRPSPTEDSTTTTGRTTTSTATATETETATEKATETERAPSPDPTRTRTSTPKSGPPTAATPAPPSRPGKGSTKKPPGADASAPSSTEPTPQRA